MPTFNPGRLVLTLALLFFGFGGIGVDGNVTHLFNPAWPPHARYHLVMQFVSFAALGAIGLWLLWRPGRDALLHLKIATLIPAVLIGSFYAAALVPTTSALYEPGMDVLRVLGLEVPPNVLVGTILLLCLPFAYRSARRALEKELRGHPREEQRRGAKSEAADPRNRGEGEGAWRP